MRTIKWTLILLIFGMGSCANILNKKIENGVVIENPNSENLKKHIGEKIIIKGKAENAKLGALLILENGQRIWMNEILSWPVGYYLGDDNAKTLKVVGILIEKNDLPVFINKENDSIIQQGIPVPEGTDLKKASHRFLLKDIKWEIIGN